MHFASLIEAGESMKQPAVYFRNITAGSLTLLEAVLAQGVEMFVFSSTAAVYGTPESLPVQEDATLKPTLAPRLRRTAPPPTLEMDVDAPDDLGNLDPLAWPQTRQA